MNAIQTLLTDHLDLWTSALLSKSTAGRGSNGKLEAYGIRKLRELIYELAAKGLLVDAASDAAAKTVNIGDVADLVMGQAPPGKECNRDGVGTIFVKTGEFGELYPAVVEWTTKPLKLAKAGDVLICVVGATVGKLNLAIDCAIGRSVAAIRPRRDIDTKYLYFSLMPYTLKLRSQSRGSAQGVIGKEELNAAEIRLPSLKEQHRIVAKVDELMALCDQLEQQQTHTIATHQALVETLLGTLTRVDSQQEFSAAWARIACHFDTLFTTEASIVQLKQTLLQLAVMGKLVPQDPNDEPASVLLEKIADKRIRLISSGQIRKPGELADIGKSEELIDLPTGWTWAFIPQIVTDDKYAIKRGPFGSAIRKDFFVSSGYKVYEQQHAIKDDFSLGEYYIDENKFNELKAFEVKPNDIIISCSGTVGKVSVAPPWMEPGIINQALLKLSLNEDALTNDYFKILFPAFYMRTETLSELQGTAQKNMVSVETLKNEPFPLPPLAEQHRIVAKVDQLMALCDTLQARIKDAQAIQLHLADAIVEQAAC